MISVYFGRRYIYLSLLYTVIVAVLIPGLWEYYVLNSVMLFIDARSNLG